MRLSKKLHATLPGGTKCNLGLPTDQIEISYMSQYIPLIFKREKEDLHSVTNFGIKI